MASLPTALVVDDSAPMRRLLTASLQQIGFEVTALSDGEGAVEAARRIRPRLICLDLMLPGVGGMELCERLRACDETADTLILITSARSSPQDRAFAEMAGADDYLIKPINPVELGERVRNLMRRRTETR